ncbi:MAG: peptidoglycan recognition family protein [Nannocystaceae bacterium]
MSAENYRERRTFDPCMRRRSFISSALGAGAGLVSSAALARRAQAGAKRPRDRRTYDEIKEVNAALLGELFAAPDPSWRPWQWLVVHHTAAEHASLAGIDRYHRNHFGDPYGAEYHFVINNGKRGALGLVEAARWRHQELAAHLFHPERAPESLALCLIGNFEARAVPEAMMDALASLSRALMSTFAIPIERVTTHREIDGRLTQCPGKHFDLADLKARIGAP